MASVRQDWSEVLTYFTGYFSAVAILAAMQLDLFTPLRNGPRTYAELARDLGVEPRRLRMLLSTLAATRLVTITDGRIANSPLADEFLVKGQPRYMGGSHELYSDLFASVLPTSQSIRTDSPQAEHEWDHLPDEQLRALLRGLNAGAAAQARTIARDSDFDRFETILDIGGGGGGFAMGVCQACPSLTAQIVDLPRIARIAQELVDSAGLGSRIKAVSHDIVEAPLPEVHQAAVVRNLLQVMSAERARRALENIGRSLRPGGEIFIVGHVLDDDLGGPPGTLAINLVFLNIYRDGEAYPESTYRNWLESAGFVDVQRRLLPGGSGHSLMTGRRAG